MRTGQSILFACRSEMQKEPSTLKKIILKHKKYLKVAFSITLISALLPIAPIAYMRVIFGPVINSGSVDFLLWISLVLILMLWSNALHYDLFHTQQPQVLELLNLN